MTGASLHSLEVWVCVCEYICVCTYAHMSTPLLELLNQPQVFFGLLHLTDSRHGLNRMSREEAAAVTSSSLPINTRSSIMSAPVPDSILSKATWNQSPNYSPSVKRMCPF